MKYAYKVNGQTIEMPISDDMVAVRFREPAPQSVRAAAVARPEIGRYEERFEVPGEKFTVFRVATMPVPMGARQRHAMEAMAAAPAVERAAPVFEVGAGYAIATDRLMVGIKSSRKAKKILADHGCEIVEDLGEEFLVKIDPGTDPFEVVASLGEVSDVEYVEPDFATFGQHVARESVNRGADASARPRDPLAPHQYALDITRARDAWAIQLGDPKIKIAILDEGVETAHPDLAAAIVGQYDGVDDDDFQEPNSWDAHGTACAGLAAAIHGNQIGIKGIGGGCSLMAVRIAYSSEEGADWTTTNSWIRRAIDWSWKSGADVLSNSWGGGAPSTAIANAFKRARTQGRGGRGAVVIVAAGNANSLHDFPGDLDDILTVSASNEYDEPKTPTSQDGEYWWGSNYGPKIDVAAPGVHNYTTDISGKGGYNSDAGQAGDYVADFNGTSSSTPIVAGAVGLMLSANPELTEEQVREIVRATADKVGPLPYVDGRNDRMGHGRVNVLAAVLAAKGGEAGTTPTGRHTPVTNIAAPFDSEMLAPAAHPQNVGSAKTAKPKPSQGLEAIATKADAARRVEFVAPNMEGLRDVAEASFGPPPLGPETVHGTDDRIRIDRTEDFPWRVHASLLITARDGSRWIGTAWFIGPRTLATAGHVVYIKNSGVPERDGWVSRISVMPGRNGSTLPYGVATSEIFHSVKGWTEDGHPDFDYGAIQIPSNLGAEVGSLGFGVLTDTELRTTYGNLAGYPGDKPNGTQWYHHNQVASFTPRKVYYDIDTVGGQSGSAVYKIGPDGDRTAFAIHAYGGATENSGARITRPVYDNFRNWL